MMDRFIPSTFSPINNSMCSDVHLSEFLVFDAGPFEYLATGSKQGVSPPPQNKEA